MNKKIIVIGRQFGSGGHEIGEKLAKELKIPFYDKRLVEDAAAELGINSTEAEPFDEKAISQFVIAYAARHKYEYSLYTGNYEEVSTDRLFQQQQKIIKELAKQGSCVIVGRCADYILRERGDVLSVFVSADFESRIERIMNKYHMSEKQAEKVILKKDKERKTYYKQHTGQKWGNSKNYHMVLNTGLLGTDEIVDILKKIYQD